MLNYEQQNIYGVTLTLKRVKRFNNKAMVYNLNNTNKHIWIPNEYLESDGTIKSDKIIDWLLNESYKNQYVYNSKSSNRKRKTTNTLKGMMRECKIVAAIEI